jgi:hypothetical protein
LTTATAIPGTSKVFIARATRASKSGGRAEWTGECDGLSLKRDGPAWDDGAVLAAAMIVRATARTYPSFRVRGVLLLMMLGW